MNSPRLPHHRRGPRVDERRYDPEERYIVKLAVGIALGILIALAAVSYVARVA